MPETKHGGRGREYIVQTLEGKAEAGGSKRWGFYSIFCVFARILVFVLNSIFLLETFNFGVLSSIPTMTSEGGTFWFVVEFWVRSYLQFRPVGA